MSELSKQALKVENNTEFPNNNNGQITPSRLRTFNEDMIDSTVNQTAFNAYSASVEAQIQALDPSGSADAIVALNAFTASQLTINSGVNSFTQSADGRLDALEAATSSYATSAITGSSLITASFDNGTRNLTFTKGDSSTFNVNIPDVSGSSGNFVTTSSFNSFTQSIDGRVDSLEAATSSYAISSSVAAVDAAQQSQINSLIAATGSFATTGSNAFVGNQTISGSVTISGSAQSDLTVVGQIFVSSSATGGTTAPRITVSGSAGRTIIGRNSITTFDTTDNGGMFPSTIYTQDSTTADEIGFTVDPSVFSISGWSNGPAIYVQNPTSTYPAVFGFQNKANYTDGRVAVLTPLSASAGFTASLQNGYAWVGNSLGQNTQVATSSFGTAINTGSFATTGSNTFTGIQNFNAAISASGALFNGDVTFNPITSTKLNGNADVGAFLYVGGGITMGGTSNAITWLGSGPIDGNFSASVDARINAITGSGTTNTGSLLVTASAAGATITFTKGDGSTFDVSVATGSVVSASYAENAGTASIARNLVVVARNGGASTLPAGTVVHITSAVGDNPVFTTASYDTEALSGNTFGLLRSSSPSGADVEVVVAGVVTGVDTDPANGYTAGDIIYLSSSGQFTNIQPQAPNQIVTLGQVLRAQQNNGSIYVSINNGWELDELHNVQITSPQTNQLLAYESASYGLWKNKTFNELGLATTGSNNFIGVETINDVVGTGQGEVYLLARSGSLVLGNSASTPTYAALSHLSSSQLNANTNLIFKTNSNTGNTIISGSGNIFVNPTTPTAGYIRYVGGAGNLFLNAQAQQLPQITGSAASVSGNRPTMNSNFIAGPQVWNINQSVNPGTHTYSHNIINGTSTMNFNMLGNTGAVTFSSNILSSPNFLINSPSASAAGVLAGISGSNALTITSNLALGGAIQYNGPVSGSAHTITGNALAGTLALNIQSGSRGYSVTNNNINGTLTVNDNTVNGPTIGSNVSINVNNIVGGVTINNRASASLNLGSNILSGFTISNDYDSMTNATVGRAFVLQGNNINGFLANNIYFSGSANGTGTTNDRGRGLYGNTIGGSRISASVIGDGNKHLLSSAIIGQGLNIYGTSLYDASNATLSGGQNGGSAFFGRWNAEDGNRANSAETVFVVGTGASGSAGITRKTGFLIDSGSNTFVEGTLNVSGSTSLTGSLTMTGSLNVTGSINVNSSSYNGQAVTNITPVSSSLSPILNIVTMTTAEYALITPNSQTLYVIV